MSEPLWRVMRDADCMLYAAEIRAVARFLAEAERNGEFMSDGLYRWLRAEADRAEAGE